ncbi:two pore domain potassium channel family protein [Rhodococcus sp. 21391]|nr:MULTISPECIES: potassium channel family protein [Rhodococcus]QQZ14012.1 two pore domain potassium channel family protein [Rhodococcus sp. 21391]
MIRRSRPGIRTDQSAADDEKRAVTVAEDGVRSLSRRARVRVLVPAVLRPVCATVVLVSAYFLLPFTTVDNLRTVSLVIGGLAVVCAVYVWQIRRVLRAEYPVAQAVEALAVTVGVYLVAYATTYFLLSYSGPDNFNEALTRLDALYFTLTVFATVGFGDIVASTEAARAVVSAQIIGNLILISLGIRVLTASVRWRRNPGIARDSSA